MDVRVVEREVAVLPFPDDVGQAAQREDVDLFVEEDAFVERQAFAGLDFVGDRGKGAFAIHTWLREYSSENRMYFGAAVF